MFGVAPHPHSYAILAYCNDCSFPELGKAVWFSLPDLGRAGVGSDKNSIYKAYDGQTA